MGKNIHGQNIIDGTIEITALSVQDPSIAQLETINAVQDVSIATLFSTIYESTQYVTVTNSDASTALILDASINILELTLDASLTQDWQPTSISGWVPNRTYLWTILKKSNNGIDLSVVRADGSIGYDNDINPFTTLSGITTTQQRAIINAVGFKSTYGQFGAMIITDSNYVE